MRRLAWFYSVKVGVFCMLLSTSQAQQTFNEGAGLKFLFKYETGHSFAYSIGMKMGMNMGIKVSTETIDMKMTVDARYWITFTPTADPKHGVTTMRMEPSNIETDWDITGPGGHIVMSLRGTEVKGTQNGIVIIDTKQNIGVAQAQELKKEILPLYLSGEVDVDDRGNVRQFRGDVPFVEFWTNELSSLGEGLFGIIFPDREVAVGDTWQVSSCLKKIGQLKLEGKGLCYTETFTREPDEIVQNNGITVFKLSASFTHKNLTGFIEQMGQRMRFNILQFDRIATGKIRFDQNQGLLLDSTIKVEGNGLMNMVVEGQTAIVDLKMDGDMRIALIPERPKATQPSTSP